MLYINGFVSTSSTVVPHYKYCYIIHIANITSILFSAIIAFLVVLLHLIVSRKSRNNLELAAKNESFSCLHYSFHNQQWAAREV